MGSSLTPWSSGLLAVSVVMAVATYLAGLLALAWKPSKRGGDGGKIAESAAAGLVIGACFCLILPEGFISFLEAPEAEGKLPEFLMGAAVLAGFLVMMIVQAVTDTIGQPPKADDEHRPTTAAPAVSELKLAQLEDGSCSYSATSFTTPSDPSRARYALFKETLSLLPGGKPDVSPGWYTSPDQEEEPGAADLAVTAAATQVLIGLLIHAAADGIAIGAASLSTSMTLSASVAIAICLHKGPVAYGLASYLLSAGWSRAQLHKGLLMFAAMTPLAGLLTYALLALLPGMNKAGHIALALLFSGGTVLYAACMHILPSALGGHASPSENHGHGHHQSAAADTDGQSRVKRLAALLCGLLLPLVVAATVAEPD